MSKKRSDCAVCGTYGFHRHGLNQKKKEGVLMKHRSNGKIIYTVHYHNQALGKYAKLHLEYLRDYQPKFYTQLLVMGQLHAWLRAIDDIAKSRFEFARQFNRPFDETEHTLFTEVIYNLKK